jgi:hypothetical protein
MADSLGHWDRSSVGHTYPQFPAKVLRHFSPVLQQRRLLAWGFWHSILRADAGGASTRARADADAGEESALAIAYRNITGFPENQELSLAGVKVVQNIPNYVQLSPFIYKYPHLSPIMYNYL